MRSVYEQRISDATEIDRTFVQGTARLCTSDFSRAVKGLHPHKTAEWLASETGQSVRAAAYELSGEREPSARSIALVVRLISRWPL